jgi:hypothetical protein
VIHIPGRRLVIALLAVLASSPACVRADEAFFSVALDGCENKIFARAKDLRRDDLALIEVRGTDGALFSVDRRFEHVPGGRVILFPVSWDHILRTLTITYSVRLKEPGAALLTIFECTVTPRGEPTGIRQIQ